MGFHLSDFGSKRKLQNKAKMECETTHSEGRGTVGCVKAGLCNLTLPLTSLSPSFLSYSWLHLGQLAYFPFLVILIKYLRCLLIRVKVETRPEIFAYLKGPTTHPSQSMP